MRGKVGEKNELNLIRGRGKEKGRKDKKKQEIEEFRKGKKERKEG